MQKKKTAMMVTNQQTTSLECYAVIAIALVKCLSVRFWTLTRAGWL